MLAELHAAYEAPATAEERGRAARAALDLGEPAVEGPGAVIGFIFGMLDGSLSSSPLFGVSDVAGKLDAESARGDVRDAARAARRGLHRELPPASGPRLAGYPAGVGVQPAAGLQRLRSLAAGLRIEQPVRTTRAAPRWSSA
jgi:hypothetical protein